MNMPHRRHHSVRFYIVVVTLIAAGLFFLLMMSDEGENSITGAFVKDVVDENVDTFEPEPVAMVEDFPFQMDFNRVPEITKEARFGEMELRFEDSKASMLINGDRLELHDAGEDVKTLKLSDCTGKVHFNERGVSLDLTARRIEVNKVALSSEKDIELSFDGLNYNYLSVDNIRLYDLKMPRGSGTMSSAEKFSYRVDQENVDITFYDGSLVIDRENATALSLDGMARGVKVDGKTALRFG